MPFREKEPLYIGRVKIPFLRRISQDVLPEGHYIEQVKGSDNGCNQWGTFWNIRGEKLVEGDFADPDYGHLNGNEIIGQGVDTHPYLKKMIAWTPSAALINYYPTSQIGTGAYSEASQMPGSSL